MVSMVHSKIFILRYTILSCQELKPIVDNPAAIMAMPSLVLLPSWGNVEQQFATNYLGPALFTMLLKPALALTKHPRVVNVSSIAQRFSTIREDINFTDQSKVTNLKWECYGQSKTGNSSSLPHDRMKTDGFASSQRPLFRRSRKSLEGCRRQGSLHHLLSSPWSHFYEPRKLHTYGRADRDGQ